MGSKTVRRWLSVTALTVAAAVSLRRVRYDQTTKKRIEDLLSAAKPTSKLTYQREDVEHLPEPVKRYFEAVLEDGQPRVRAARLSQRGEFRFGGRSGSWKPLRATQYYTVDPPGFVWDADIEVLPFVSVRVVDAYERGRGSLRAMLLSAFSVANALPGEAMNEGELLRYLAEAVWFPTALLPGEHVEWEPIDEYAARATIEDRGNTASLVFHFDDEGLVRRVSAAERYRQEDDSLERWTGYFSEYEWHDGIRIPTEASVEWTLPSGDMPYWRASIESVGYRQR
ncbi:DUF6544 family protein [Halogeometricum borinquense]|uniref:DUF6544 family protein n=1 Tax=Halogeometricum borinquense TaxID=60847 RepID=UPI003420B19F